MRLTEEEARRRFAAAPVARLATADEAGVPHLVPFTFAVLDAAGSGDRIVHAVDHKPKRTTALRRLANLRANPVASALVDHYDEDWSRLWWVRADGTTELWDAGAGFEAGVRALAAKYPAYRDRPPGGPMVALTVTRWTGWQAADPASP